MTETENVRDELIHMECKKDCCARAEICAAILLSGGVSFRGMGRYGLSLTATHANASRYYFQLIKRLLGVSCEIRTGKTDRLGQLTRYELVFPEDSVSAAMDELMLRDPEGLFGIRSSPADELLTSPCCGAAFLKSAFITTGSLSNPEKEYSLTLTSAGEDMALKLKQLLLDRGIQAGLSTRRERCVVYVKDAESISAFLAITGAHTAMLALENVRIVKDLRNQANRMANCDRNNIRRTVRSAGAQIEKIRFLAQAVGIDKLPEWAREIASLRLEDPEASLTELGEMCDPPIGKSGVNNRLRRLCEMADRLREDSHLDEI